jgi:hypothetical protein
MGPDRQGCRWFDVAWFMFWAFASSVWCLTAASRLSSTFDEPFYVENGLHAWRTGSYHTLLKAGTMPLPVDVEMLPVYVWEQLRGKPFDSVADFDVMLPVARAANLAFWWLLLLYGFRLGRLCGGALGGRLAVLFLACEPNLLGHACLATTDIAASACLLGFIYHYLTGRGQGWWRRAGVPGLWYGVAMLAKASALAFGPVAMVTLELARQWQASLARCGPQVTRRECLKAFRAHFHLFPESFWTIIGIGLAVTFTYCSSDFQQERSFAVWAGQLPEGPARTFVVPLADNLRIFPNAGSGLVYQIKHNMRGHGAYLFGEWYPRAVPYYFPAALLIKLTLPALALMLLLLIVRPWALASPAGLILAVLIVFSLSCRVQIGIRLVFPLVCFWMIALAAGLSKVMNSVEGLSLWAIPTAVLSALLIVPPLTTWPDGLRYANRAWGGPESTYCYLSDSNCDWGQGLKDLQAWRERHGNPPLKVWYYGKDPVFMRSMEFCPLQSYPIASPAEVYAVLRGSYLAVSTSILYRDPNFTPASVEVFAVLKGMQPIARTSTFFIYDFTDATLSP